MFWENEECARTTMFLVRVFSLFVFCTDVFGIKAMLVRPQLYSSPCPDTFQYRTDYDGRLYGSVGVYSFDQNVVVLDVELSVANRVDNFNGRIELATTKQQVLDDIQNRRPIRYNVIFPRWDNIPPKLTKVTVNGQNVCSGPPIPMNGWINVLTRVNLQHKFTIQVTPLRIQNPFIPTNEASPQETPFQGEDPSGKPRDNPFLSRGNSKDYNVDFKPRPPKETFISNQFSNNLITSTTPSTTTQKNALVNDLLFPENPFLSGRTAEPSSSTARSSSDETCGVSIVANPLIINGNSVPRGAFPWLIAMFSIVDTGLEYKCSGSLVSSTHVVTAAHCLHRRQGVKIPADKLVFVLGKLNIKKWPLAEDEMMVEAAETFVHPDYEPLKSDADVAVVMLAKSVRFSKYIRPICLWSESDDIDGIVGLKGKVVGWGRDEHDNLMTAEPKQANVPVVSQEQCLRSAQHFRFITSQRTFCGGERNNSGPCNGDSGAGFIMKRNGRWCLRGVVSISLYDSEKQTCDLSNYVVFTDVSKFRTWLFSIVNNQ